MRMWAVRERELHSCSYLHCIAMWNRLTTSPLPRPNLFVEQRLSGCWWIRVQDLLESSRHGFPSDPPALELIKADLGYIQGASIEGRGRGDAGEAMITG